MLIYSVKIVVNKKRLINRLKSNLNQMAKKLSHFHIDDLSMTCYFPTVSETPYICSVNDSLGLVLTSPQEVKMKARRDAPHRSQLPLKV